MTADPPAYRTGREFSEEIVKLQQRVSVLEQQLTRTEAAVMMLQQGRAAKAEPAPAKVADTTLPVANFTLSVYPDDWIIGVEFDNVDGMSIDGLKATLVSMNSFGEELGRVELVSQELVPVGDRGGDHWRLDVPSRGLARGTKFQLTITSVHFVDGGTWEGSHELRFGREVIIRH